MKKITWDWINGFKYLMVVLLVAYVVFLIAREGNDSVSVDAIDKNIMKVTNTEGLSKGNTQDLKKYYGLNADDYAGAVLYIPDDVMSVNEILVIKVKDKSQVESVEQAIEERLETQKNNFEGYGVEQTKLINSAVVETKGYYVLVAVSKDADKIDGAFKESIS